MESSKADRNLLYGVLALQMGFVTRDALIGGMLKWIHAKGKGLDEILMELGRLALADHAAVEHAVRRYLEKHEDDAARCLTELDFELSDSVRQLLEPIDDGDLRESLARLESRVSTGPTMAPPSDETTVWGAKVEPSEDRAGNEDRARAVEEGGRLRYQALRLHAKGGLGEVYVAWDEEMGRYVALKEIRKDHAKNMGLRARFEREAEVNGNLEHPGIVPVYGMGRHEDGRPYYAMRFVKGETLQHALERFHEDSRGLSPAQWHLKVRPLVSRFLVICEAIGYAHARGVLHRDLKPSNIMLGQFGETMLIDWGLAKVTGQPELDLDLRKSDVNGEEAEAPGPVPIAPSSTGPLSTYAGETLGSPPYMSPEQARGEHDHLTSASDIYSLGATLFAVLTGRPPVTGKNTKDVVARVARGQIDRARTVEPRVPKPLEEICAKALSLEPSDRYASARRLAEDLEHFLADEPVGVYEDPWSTRLLRWAKRRRTLVASLLVLLLTALAGLAIANVLIGKEKDRALEAQHQAEVAQEQARRHLALGFRAYERLVNRADKQLVEQASPQEREELLRSAIQFLEAIDESYRGARDVEERMASVALRLANLYRMTGRYGDAAGLYDQAVRIDQRLAETDPGNAAAADRLAECLIDRAEARLQSKQPKLALEDAEWAERLARANKGKLTDHSARRTLSRTLTELAAARRTLGLPGAVDAAREAVAELEPVADESLPKAGEMLRAQNNFGVLDQLLVMQSQMQEAGALEEAGEAAAAASVLNRALERVAALWKSLGESRVENVDVFDTLIRLQAQRLRLRTGLEPADPGELDRVVDESLFLAEKRGDILRRQLMRAESLIARAQQRVAAGEVDKAQEDATAAFAEIEELLPRNPNTEELPGLRAEALDVLARAMGTSPERRQVVRALRREEVASLESFLTFVPGNPVAIRRLEEARKRLEEAER